MSIKDINDLKAFLITGKSLQIAILDNCSVDFLSKISNWISGKIIFKDYDLILIPEWINAEINDSKTRHNYIEQLIADDLPVFFY